MAESGRTGGGSPDHHDQQILKPKTACVRIREIPFPTYLAVGEKGCAWHLDRVRPSSDRSGSESHCEGSLRDLLIKERAFGSGRRQGTGSTSSVLSV